MKKKYTVLLRTPDYIDSDQPVYALHVEAEVPAAARTLARKALITDLEDDLTYETDLDAYTCVAVYPGWLKNIDPGP